MTRINLYKKHNPPRRLTVQLLMIFLPVMLLLLTVNGLFLYQTGIRQAKRAQYESAYYRADDMCEVIKSVSSLPLVLTFLEEHPDLMEEALERAAQVTDLSSEEYWSQVDELLGFEEALGVSDLMMIPQEEFLSRDEEWQGRASVVICLNIWTMLYTFLETKVEALQGPVLIRDTTDGGLRVWYNADQAYALSPGEILSPDETSLKKLHNAEPRSLSEGVSEQMAEDAVIKASLKEEGKTKTLVLVPVFQNLEQQVFVGFGINNNYIFQRCLLQSLSLIVIDLLLCILLGAGLWAAAFYLVVKPLENIQRQLHTYIKEKDSGELTSGLDRIRSGNEIGTLSYDIAHVVRDLEQNASEKQQLADERAQMDKELEHAAAIQRSMLPREFPPDGSRLELYASMTPAKEVGGDLYDFFRVDSNHIAMVIADVSGKGIPAALFMMRSRTLIKRMTLTLKDPAVILEQVNDALCENNEENQFITTWMLLLDLTSGRCAEVNAGHTKPALWRKGGGYQLVRTMHDLPLGMMENISFRVNEWVLEPGERVFVYTDGLTEAENVQQEQFGEERLLAALNEAGDISQEALLKFVTEKVHAFTGEAEQSDDLTMMGFTYMSSGVQGSNEQEG